MIIVSLYPHLPVRLLVLAPVLVVQIWTQGPPTLPCAAPRILASTVASLDVSWEKARLGDHDAEIKGYVVSWKVVDARSTASTDAPVSGEVRVGSVLSFTITVRPYPSLLSLAPLLLFLLAVAACWI